MALDLFNWPQWPVATLSFMDCPKYRKNAGLVREISHAQAQAWLSAMQNGQVAAKSFCIMQNSTPGCWKTSAWQQDFATQPQVCVNECYKLVYGQSKLPKLN